jgi:uncharacterized protein YdeI (YjbR/CyaY-like superfamily)
VIVCTESAWKCAKLSGVVSELDPKLTKTFRAKLEATGTSLHWVIVRVALDLRRAWPMWTSRRVLGEINGFAFRTALMPGKASDGFTLIVNKQMQAGAGAHAGDAVKIRLSPDLGEVAIEMPAEFAKILRSDRALKKFFDGMSPSMRKGFTSLIGQGKTYETRRKRAEAMSEALAMAMEGEFEPPPVLRVAFQRQPEAQLGWKLMTPTQRRNHLLGIFYLQTVDGREKRAAKAIENCLEVARKRKSS